MDRELCGDPFGLGSGEKVFAHRCVEAGRRPRAVVGTRVWWLLRGATGCVGGSTTKVLQVGLMALRCLVCFFTQGSTIGLGNIAADANDADACVHCHLLVGVVEALFLFCPIPSTGGNRRSTWLDEAVAES